MGKLKQRLARIPKGRKILVNLLLIALALCLRYVFAGLPTFSLEGAFRRAERSALVGPAEILGTVSVDERFGYTRLLLAEEEEGVTLYCHDGLSGRVTSMEGRLIHRKKTGRVTVLAAPTQGGFLWTIEEYELPVILFDDFPEAVRAELDLCVYADYKDEEFTRKYLLSAKRENPGFFTFRIHCMGGVQVAGAQGYAMMALCELAMADKSYLTTAFPAAVRLYDAAGALLHEETLVLRSPSGEAHARRGDLRED